MLQLTSDGREFSVIFKDHEILRHSPARSIIDLGTGVADFRPNKNHQAFFRPRDLRTRMKPLIAFDIIEQSDESASVELEGLLRLDFGVVDERLEITIGLIGDSHPQWNRFTFRVVAEPGEHIYGLGEQFIVLDVKGKKVPLWTQEPGLARDRSILALIADLMMGAGGRWHTTYFPQPTFISSAHYFVHADAYSYAVFDFTAKDHHELRFWSVPAKIVIDARPTAAETLGSLSAYLGRQRPLPDWAIKGVWLGIGGGLDEAKDGESSVPWKVRRAIEAGVPVSAVWCEDWTGLYRASAYETRLFWNWRFDAERYPDLPTYIQSLHDQGIKFLGYDNCFLMRHGDLYKEAAGQGYLVKHADGTPYDIKMLSFSAGMLDLTNLGCRDWIKGIIQQEMIDVGLDGWMCDFGEYLPIDAALHSGEDPALVHNEYPVSWAKVNYEAVSEAGRLDGDDAIVFFNRSGNAGTSKYSPLIWSGDQQVTFQKGNGLPAAIAAGISMGLSGIGHHHSDIGGYFGFLWIKRTKELFMRWCEFATFTPVMRTHCRKDFTATIDWQWYSDDETLAHFARFGGIHEKMLPYIKRVLDEYQQLGLPAIRHPWIHYEGDETVHGLKYEYLFGPDLLVAPVCKKGAKKWRVYLPSYEWIHLWSGKKWKKGWAAVQAPIGQPPVFYRAGSEFTSLFETLKDA
jgi:alpha-glucosidase